MVCLYQRFSHMAHRYLSEASLLWPGSTDHKKIPNDPDIRELGLINISLLFHYRQPIFWCFTMFCCGPLISPRLPRQPLQVLWHLSSSNMLPQNLFSCHLFISRKLSLTFQTNSRDLVTWGQTHLFSGPLLLLLWAPFHLSKGSVAVFPTRR